MFTKKKAKKLAIAALALSMSVSMFAGTTLNASAMIIGDGKFYTDYSSKDEAMAAADLLNTEISGEGNVLLKNDGVLPLNGNEKISVFGGAQDSMVGASGSVSVTQALKNEGFNVNPSLENYYKSAGHTIGKEIGKNTLSKGLEGSFDLYGDAAVIVLSRTGGEGADLNTVMTEIEDNKDGNGEDYGWKHEALLTDEAGEHKHYLQLTDSEEEMIAYVKANFDKIVVLLNTSNAMEMANLQNDDAINAILWIGRPGSTGITAMAQILNGEINPSGKMVDEWNRDFSADPVWQNFGLNKQVGTTHLYDYDYENIEGAPKPGKGNGYVGGDGYYGIDYDEDIYLGYKYWETVYAELKKDETIRYDATTNKIVAKAEITEDTYNAEEAAEAWWTYAVVYPFGYGLSYTTFTQELGDVYYYLDGAKTNLAETVDGSIFASEKDSPAKVETLYAPVKVTNTGNVAGKQVVQIYVTAPYTAGGVEKSEVTLVGFAKTDVLKPGKSQTVTVEFNVQDFASYDYDDKNASGYEGYELDLGNYTIKAMEDSHRVIDSVDFEITSTTGKPVALKLDDFSGNEIETLFSNGDMYDTIRGNYATEEDGSDAFLNVNKTDAPQVLLSRAAMDKADELAVTEAERALSDEFVKYVVYWTGYTSTNQEKYNDEAYTYYKSADSAETGKVDWYKTEAELKALMAGWTQATTAPALNEYLLKDMTGLDWMSEDPVPAGSKFYVEGAETQMTQKEAWIKFMNQLTWAEIQTLVCNAMRATSKLDSIGKTATSDPNGPNDYCGKYWCDQTVVSSTWNVELGEQYGIINGNLALLSGNTTRGWYGPGINTHRSPFSGRNNEYYSQDGIQGGYMAAAVVRGAQSRGINVWMKHAFMNDQEENRSRQCLFTWASEQAIREIYAKPFQMAMQEGEGTGCMVAYNRIGGVVACANYNYLTRLVRDEWGWRGEFVTDYYGNNAIQANSMDLLARAGCDLPDGNATSATDKLGGTFDATLVGVGTADAPSGNIVVGSGENTNESLTQWYYGRMSATRVLYVAAHTSNVNNGVATSNFKAKTIELVQGQAASNVSVAMPAEDLSGASVTYAVTSGTLPAGLSLNASTGAITGKTTEVGSTRVTITATADGWYAASAQFTFNVASAFTLSENAGEVGAEFEAFIESEYVSSSSYNQGITYSVVDGELPAGLELDGDAIIGTPTKPGTYKATIQIVGTNKSGNSWRPTTTTDTFNYEITITITGEEIEVPVEPDFQVRITEEGMIQITNDAGETWVDVINKSELKGEAGEAGAPGQAGADAVAPTVEISEDGYWVINGEKTEVKAVGQDGAPGKDGEDGAKGDKGDKGDKGETGPKGEDGKDAEGGDFLASLGCSSSIAGTAIASLATLIAIGGALVAKKRED